MKSLLEKALNHYLAFDPASEQRMAVLNDKTVTIELLGIALTFQLVFCDGKIQLRWKDFLEPDLVISGTPLNLLHMSILPASQRQVFFAEDVKVTGNMELARHVLAIFDEMSVDWEEISARLMGDIPAHQLGRFVRGIKNFSARVRGNFVQNVNEYVHEEINLVPPTEALQDFLHQVDDLRMDVDRLEARVTRLRKMRDAQ